MLIRREALWGTEARIPDEPGVGLGGVKCDKVMWQNIGVRSPAIMIC